MERSELDRGIQEMVNAGLVWGWVWVSDLGFGELLRLETPSGILILNRAQAEFLVSDWRVGGMWS